MKTNSINPIIPTKIRGVDITDEIKRELFDNGRSHVLKFKNGKGKQYLAYIEYDGLGIKVVPEAKYLEHRCPHCGGRILITGKGYFCENFLNSESHRACSNGRVVKEVGKANNLGTHPSCKFHCKGILSHRFVQPHEIEAFLDGHPVILDGCYNDKGHVFSAVLVENPIHGFSLTSVVDQCPDSGTDVLVSPVAFNCRNYNGLEEPYRFSFWRHIKGHAVTLDELHELLHDGCTSSEVILNDENGSLSKAYLRLSPDGKRIVPDFYSAK